MTQKITTFNRKIIIISFFLLLFNYLLFSVIIERSPFDLFPQKPLLGKKEEITLYLPSLNGKTFFEEKRLMKIPKQNKAWLKVLLEEVIKGSAFENTSQTVPVNLFLKKIWIHKEGEKNIAVLDFDPFELNQNVDLIKNSGKNFKLALTKTIKKNLPEINDVYLLESGQSSANLWDL